jgi:hypothetical protein
MLTEAQWTGIGKIDDRIYAPSRRADWWTETYYEKDNWGSLVSSWTTSGGDPTTVYTAPVITLEWANTGNRSYQFTSGRYDGVTTLELNFTFWVFDEEFTVSFDPAVFDSNGLNTPSQFFQYQAARIDSVIAYSFPYSRNRTSPTEFEQVLHVARIGDSTNPNLDILGVDDINIFLGMLSRV